MVLPDVVSLALEVGVHQEHHKANDCCCKLTCLLGVGLVVDCVVAAFWELGGRCIVKTPVDVVDSLWKNVPQCQVNQSWNLCMSLSFPT